MTPDLEQQLAGVAALSDPVRRALYRFVAESPEPVSRAQAAAAVGVQKPLAAFHLDRLAEEGLLSFEFRRLTGRTGPGAGRPSKVYRRSGRQIDVSLPQREYGVAGMLLAGAIEASESSGRSVRAELQHAARQLGRTIGRRAQERVGARSSKAKRRAALLQVLAEHGFEPRVVGRDVVLANCPFHDLAQHHAELVCDMNLHLLQGVRSEHDVGGNELEPVLSPQPGQCCVRFTRRS